MTTPATATPTPVRPTLKLALIGSLPPPVGGTTVSLTQLHEFLLPRVASCTVIDTSPRGQGRLKTLLGALRQLVRQRRDFHVATMHFSDAATVSAAPLIWLVCRLLRKPLVHRQFGGEFEVTYAQLPAWRRWLVDHTVLRCDAVLLQTKSMVARFEAPGRHIVWFPTARTPTGLRCAGAYAQGHREQLRCLFVGHVREAKGVLDAVAAVQRVAQAELTVCGPLIDVQQADLQLPRVSYLGPLAPEQVAPTMAAHDLLLFPSRYKGEGYSGTLVEAAQVGLPMLITRWQSLPEMFREDEASFVAPDSVAELAQELARLAGERVELLARSQRLLRRSADFDAGQVFGRFLQVCAELAPAGSPSKER